MFWKLSGELNVIKAPNAILYANTMAKNYTSKLNFWLMLNLHKALDTSVTEDFIERKATKTD